MSSLTWKSVKFKTKMFWQDNYAILLFVLQFVSNKENSVFLYKSWHKRGKKNPSKRCETNKLITNYHNDVLREKNLYIFNEWGAQKAKKAADTWAAFSGIGSNNNLGGQTVKRPTQNDIYGNFQKPVSKTGWAIAHPIHPLPTPLAFVNEDFWHERPHCHVTRNTTDWMTD